MGYFSKAWMRGKTLLNVEQRLRPVFPKSPAAPPNLDRRRWFNGPADMT